MRSTLVFAAVMLAVVSLLSCNPCSGMGPCFRPPHVSVIGVLRDESSGVPVQGARIDLIRTGGPALAHDSVRTLTDSRGNFLINVDALDSGQVAAQIVVRAPESTNPPGFGYRVYDLTLKTLDGVGDARVFLPWSTTPTLPDLARLVRSGTPLANVAVEFRRTGGVRFAGSDIFQTTTDGQGLVELFHFQVQPLDAGDVVGDLFVDGALTYSGLHLPATPEFRPEVILRIIDLDAP